MPGGLPGSARREVRSDEDGSGSGKEGGPDIAPELGWFGERAHEGFGAVVTLVLRREAVHYGHMGSLVTTCQHAWR